MPLGVYFENVQIMTIEIPPGLRRDLATTTSYDTKLQNQIKKYENEKLHIMNSENQKLIELQRNNARELTGLNADNKQALIHREESIITKESIRSVEVT